MIDHRNKFYRALKEVAPFEIEALNTQHSQKIMNAYETCGYWLSEMYDYMPEMRHSLRVCLKQVRGALSSEELSERQDLMGLE